MSDQYIKEASALMEQAKGALSAGADKVQAMAGNPDVQKLLPYLLAGGAGAAGGAFLSGRRRKRSGETRGQYLTRILSNALVAGGLVGGGSYLAHKGFSKTLGAVDTENPLTGKAENQGPLGTLGRGIAFSPLTAGLAGGGALAATAGSKTFGANPDAGEAEKLLMAAVNKANPQANLTIEDLKHKAKVDNPGLQALLGKADTAEGKALREYAQTVGINAHDASKTVGVPGFLQKILKTDKIAPRHLAHELARPGSALLGRTTGRRLGRGLIGGAAALTPAAIGAILSDKPE